MVAKIYNYLLTSYCYGFFYLYLVIKATNFVNLHLKTRKMKKLSSFLFFITFIVIYKEKRKFENNSNPFYGAIISESNPYDNKQKEEKRIVYN